MKFFVGAQLPLAASPRKLLFVSTGNITNDELIGALRHHSGEIFSALEESNFVELTRFSIVVHG